ncbi:hypothetical protein EFA46_011360 (plasmid) [Halarchaeum sp. CBA1220]|uniref:hypothetical protein n=1 Tax=Halarchaeum sp. CBA1220 TaxID=1853682 RepID=UPI000F3A9EA2|nr:hypothetical protein [Halarchaeum sp. CBA1220]QLC34852.1 hypothetical protein EFA46_011360 [Halarchaeum sp. CBA1220]
MSPTTQSLHDATPSARRALRAALSLLPSAPGIVVAYAGLALVTAVSNTVANLVSAAVLGAAIVVAAGALGLDTDVQNSLGVRLLLAVIAAIVAGVAIIIGFVFLVLPGVYLAVRLRLVVAAVVLEDCGPLEALGRSLELTAGEGWTVLGVWLATTLLNAVAASAAILLLLGDVPDLGTRAGLVALQNALPLGAALGTFVSGPVTAASDAVLYGWFADAMPDEDASNAGASGVRAP